MNIISGNVINGEFVAHSLRAALWKQFDRQVTLETLQVWSSLNETTLLILKWRWANEVAVRVLADIKEMAWGKSGKKE